MKKLLLILVPVFILTTVFVWPVVNATDSKPKGTEKPVLLDPFDNDPFFQSQDEVFQQMNKMQEAMNQFIKNQFAQMHSNITHLPNQNHFANTRNIQIEEKNDTIVYKIRLAEGVDSKVNVSIENRTLLISTRVSQKITQEQNKYKNMRYIQSNYSQSFELPKEYDPNSMETKNQDSTLLVSFKKQA